MNSSTPALYTFGRMYSARTGQARIGYRPSKKSIQITTCWSRGEVDQPGVGELLQGGTGSVTAYPAAHKGETMRTDGRGTSRLCHGRRRSAAGSRPQERNF